MKEFTIYCTTEQTKRALELGALIDIKYGSIRHRPSIEELKYLFACNDYWHVIPTAEQMIGWLRTKGFKFILSDAIDSDEGNNWWVAINDELIAQGFSENKELAAIDAALEYLSDSNYDNRRKGK